MASAALRVDSGRTSFPMTKQGACLLKGTGRCQHLSVVPSDDQESSIGLTGGSETSAGEKKESRLHDEY
jgi:hypothetical protein